MPEKREAINFPSLIADVVGCLNLPEEGWPVIVGGAVEVEALHGWLTGLDPSGYSVAVLGYSDHVTIGEVALPEQGEVELLDHIRLFGKGGDLDGQRDGNTFHWRYIGSGAGAPKGDSLTWPGSEENPVFWRDQTALLWGNRPEGKATWYEDRVAGAALTYPVKGAPERVQVRYREYTQAGRPFAVWFRGLEAYNG